MKNVKILFSLFVLIIASVVFIQSCTSDTNEVTKSNQINLETEKPSQIIQDTQIENLSTVTKEEYLSMSSQKKIDFKQAYIYAFKNGGGCTCNDCCSVDCPSGTKPNCQCGTGECICQCEPYGSRGISIRFSIHKNDNGSVILTEKASSKNTLDNFANSNLPNAKKIANLFESEPIFNKENKKVLHLTAKEYYAVESKFQSFIKNYNIEQYFELEYRF